MSKQLPSVFTTQTFDDAFRTIPTADLLAELESDRWLALELADHQPSRAYCEHMIDRTIRELERRQRLLARLPDDPLAPRWPERPRLEDRFAAVKDQFPIEHFCTNVMMCRLERRGSGFVAHCPLPGHDDSSPSFTVTPEKGFGWCFGCGRGGDVITLTREFFGLGRNYEALELLESMSGIGRAA